MTQKIFSFVVLFALANLTFGVWTPAYSQIRERAVKSLGMETLSGTIRVMVYEEPEQPAGDEQVLTGLQFYLESCSGAPCDFEALRQSVSVNKLSEQDVRTDYLLLSQNGKFDFKQFANRKVTIQGRSVSGDPVKRFSREKSQAESFAVHSITDLDPSALQQNNLAIAPMTAPPPTIGTGKVLVGLINTPQSVPFSPYTREDMKQWVFTGSRSVNDFFKENSYGKYKIGGIVDPVGDVTPWINLETDFSGDCAAAMNGAGRQEFDNKAEQLGYSKLGYRIRVMLFAGMPSCTRGAFATVGTFGDQSGVVHINMQVPSSGSLQELFGFRLSVLIHEFGHALGQATHSMGQQSQESTALVFGDNADPLGDSDAVFFNNVMRMKFGWMAPFARVYPVIQTRGTFLVNLQSPAIPTKGIGPSSPPPVVFVAIYNNGSPTGEYFVLERRRDVGRYDRFDTDIRAYANGLLIRRVMGNLESMFSASVIMNPDPSKLCCKEAALVPDSSGRATWVSNKDIVFTAFAPTLNGMTVRITTGSNHPTP